MEIDHNIRQLPANLHLKSVIFFFVSVFVSLSTQLSQVIFESSPGPAAPAITILQHATFRCSIVTDPANTVTFQWRVNGTLSSDPFWESIGISLTVHGSSTDSYLTVPGHPVLNGTEVELKAAIFNGGFTTITRNDKLFIQGKPAGVDLNCTLFSLYTIKCYWSIPYTIRNVTITGYNVNITSSNDTTSNLIPTTVNETEYSYNVSEPGVYNVSVAAMIGELEGDYSVILVPLFEDDSNEDTNSPMKSNSTNSSSTDHPKSDEGKLFSLPTIIAVVAGGTICCILIVIILIIILGILCKYCERKKCNKLKNSNAIPTTESYSTSC